MGQSIGDQFRNMFITEFVEHMLSFARRFDDALTLQQLQSLRHGRHIVVHCRSNLGNAHFPGADEHQDSQSVEVAQSAEKVCSSLAGNRIQNGIPETTTASVVVLSALG